MKCLYNMVYARLNGTMVVHGTMVQVQIQDLFKVRGGGEGGGGTNMR